MKKFIFLCYITLLCANPLATAYAESSFDEQIASHYAGDGKNKGEGHREKSLCDSIFCQAAPLIVAQMSTAPITGTDAQDTFTLPIAPMADGFGNDYRISNSPLIRNGQILAPANRIDILNCGWYRVGFTGFASNNGTGVQAVTVSLRSNVFNDVIIGRVFPGSGTPGIFNNLCCFDLVYITQKPDNCALPYYYVEISDVESGVAIQFDAESFITIQRVGSCGCCPKGKPCCPSYCKCSECKKT